MRRLAVAFLISGVCLCPLAGCNQGALPTAPSGPGSTKATGDEKPGVVETPGGTNVETSAPTGETGLLKE